MSSYNKSITPKQALLNRAVTNGEYCLQNRTGKTTSSELPTIRKRKPTKVLEDTAKLRALSENKLNFELTQVEIEFIQDYANKFSISYEQSVVQVLHDAIKHLRLSVELIEKYEK